MGWLVVILMFIWKVIKLIVKIVVKTAWAITNAFIKMGLLIPFMGLITILLLWLFDVIGSNINAALFINCWLLLLALTFVNILYNIKRRGTRKRKEKEREELIRRFEEDEKRKAEEEKQRIKDEKQARKEEKQARWRRN